MFTFLLIVQTLVAASLVAVCHTAAQLLVEQCDLA